jgi:hypothetical protein
MSSPFQQQLVVTDPERIVAQNAMFNSNNSFTLIFIVLVIIAVVSVTSCIIGQFCSRRYLQPRHRKVPDEGLAMNSDARDEGRLSDQRIRCLDIRTIRAYRDSWDKFKLY